jgi:ankyrin repeat protein
MLASEQGHLEIVRALIAAGADVNAKTSRGETALMDASDNGNPEIVQALLAAKADLNAEDEMGRTAMMRVSGHEGHSHIVRLLFEASGEGKIVERMAVAAIVILGAYFALIRRRKRGRAR